MASLVLVIKGTGVDGLKQDSSARHVAIHDIVNHLEALNSGNEKGTVYCHSSTSNPVAASGTITCASVLADDTVTIGAVTLTGKASPSGENQFDSDGADDVVAAAIAAKINAHSTLSKVMSATAASAVVTVTCLQHGVIGNQIVLTSSGVTLAVTGMTGGTGGVENSASTYACGQ